MGEKCRKCHLPIEGEIFTARLGADEAGEFIKCRCKERKEAFYKTKISYQLGNHLHREVQINDPARTSSKASHTILDGFPAKFEYEIRISPQLLKNLADYLTTNVEIDSQIEWGCSAWCSLKKEIYLGRFRLRSSEGSLCKIPIQEKKLAHGISYHKSLEIQCPPVGHTSYTVLTVKMLLFKCERFAFYYRQHNPDDSFSAELEFDQEVYASVEPSADDILDAMQFIMSRIYSPSLLKVSIKSEFRRSLFAACPRVKDARSLTEAEYNFMIKADGEMCWIFDSGNVLYFTRNDPNITCMGYLVYSSRSVYDAKFSVYRCELLQDGRMIYIDTIALNGCVSSSRRPYVPDLPPVLQQIGFVIKRQIYETAQEASDAREWTDLPSDGVIAISKLSSLTYRIKEPTMDLIRQGNDLCYRGRNKKLIRHCSSIPDMKQNVIYECVFDGRLEKITSWKPRLDKTMPNDYKAAESLIELYREDEMGHSIVRRGVTDACFQFRERVHHEAHTRLGRVRLIVDLGTGRNQAERIWNLKETSYVFCDPNLKVHSHWHKNSVTITDPANAYNSICWAAERVGRVVMFQGLAEDLLTHDICRYLSRNQVPVIYMFSATHLVDMVWKLARYGVPQIMCSYFYDSVKDGGTLIDDPSGITMTVDADRAAQVEFKPDLKITEYPLTVEELEPSMIIDHEQVLETDSVTTRTLSIVKHVKVIMIE